jgi:hypothetical protein
MTEKDKALFAALKEMDANRGILSGKKAAEKYGIKVRS